MPFVRLGSLIKKTLHHPKTDEEARQSFQKTIKEHKDQGKTIVYIDESVFAHDMPRTHGYAPKGKRCHGVCDWQARGRINVIGALVGTKLVTASLFECNVDSDVFHTWITEDLMPKLPPGCVIVMDNASFHKRQDTQEAIKNAKHPLQFLPPYSPDLNPIEHTWAQAKAIRKQNHTDTHSLFTNPKLYHS